MAIAKVLLVEDEADVAALLRKALEREGYAVVAAADGVEGLSVFGRERPDAVLLDVMLPRLDGFDFMKVVRRSSATPILMLTARTDEVDKVLGLELGADDYITKPFSVREVLARLAAVLRRSAPGAPGTGMLRAGSLSLDRERHEVRLGDAVLELTPKEFGLLSSLLEAGGRVRSREDLLAEVWRSAHSHDLDTRTVDQHVLRLREKLGPEADRLRTVRGAGYRIVTD